MFYFRHGAVAVALLAGVSAAGAQSTVLTREPVQSQTVVTGEALQLTPVQRQTIYRTVVREPVAAPPPTIEYRVGARVPDSVRLYSIPESVAVEVPAVKTCKYMTVNGRVFLFDPATSQVVAEFAR